MLELIPDSEYDDLMKTFKDEPSIDKVIVFGSRARGDHRNNSDIDLALVGEDIPDTISLDISEASGLYKVDVIHYNKVKNANLLAEIDREGKVVFQR